MYIVLAVFAALIGLAVTGSAVFTAYFVWRLQKQGDGVDARKGEAGLPGAGLPDARLLLRWTVLDYSLIGLVGIGLLFLFADVLGVVRDREAYPFHHYGYLLIGFVFTLIGVLFLVARLLLLLRAADVPRLGAPNHHDKPDHADQTEQRV